PFDEHVGKRAHRGDEVVDAEVLCAEVAAERRVENDREHRRRRLPEDEVERVSSDGDTGLGVREADAPLPPFIVTQHLPLETGQSSPPGSSACGPVALQWTSKGPRMVPWPPRRDL